MLESILHFSDVCLELPFILTHPSGSGSCGNETCDISDEQLDLQSEWQMSHHSDTFLKNGHEELEEEGNENGTNGSPDNSPLPLEPSSLAGPAAPQMGVLARTGTRGPLTPPPATTGHIAEFRRASDLYDESVGFPCSFNHAPSPFTLFGAVAVASEVNSASITMLPSGDR